MDTALGTLERSKEAFTALIEEIIVDYVQAFESLKAQVGTVGESDLFEQARILWESLGTRSPWRLLKEDPRFKQAVKGLMQALIDDVVQRNDSLWASMIPLMDFNYLSMIREDSFDAALSDWSHHINPDCVDKVKCLLDNLEKHPHIQDARKPRINRTLRQMADFVPEATDTLRERICSFFPEDVF